MNRYKNLSNFNLAFNALPTILQKEVREIIKKECYLENDCQFYNRKSGRVKIRDYEAARIVEIFSKYGINAFTGKILKTSIQKVDISTLNNHQNGLQAVNTVARASA